MASMDLLAETYRLLDACDMTRAEIAASAGVGPHWLEKFAQRKIKNPGVKTVQQLYEFLASNAAVSAA